MSRPDKPARKFKLQRRNAARRGIPWELTYEQWLEVWMESGRWPQRGQREGQYVMARKRDIGPYAVGNVFICLHSENVSDGFDNHSGPLSRSRALGTGKGWCIKKGKYVVSVRHKTIGTFWTQQEAEAAYQAKVAEIKAAA